MGEFFLFFPTSIPVSYREPRMANGNKVAMDCSRKRNFAGNGYSRKNEIPREAKIE